MQCLGYKAIDAAERLRPKENWSSSANPTVFSHFYQAVNALRSHNRKNHIFLLPLCKRLGRTGNWALQNCFQSYSAFSLEIWQDIYSFEKCYGSLFWPFTSVAWCLCPHRFDIALSSQPLRSWNPFMRSLDAFLTLLRATASFLF